MYNKIAVHNWYIKHKKEKLAYDRKYRKEYFKKYRKEHRKQRRKYEKHYEKLHRNKISKRKRKYYQVNHIRIQKVHTKYMRKARKNNINLRLAENLRRRINVLIKQSYKLNYNIMIGCSIKYLQSYLEKQFKPGMSWKNYGKWHIDHIKQCCKFDLSKSSEQKKCFNYKNLRPLWAMDNLKRPKRG